MKYLLFTTLAVCAFAVTPAMAEDDHDDHDEERVKHYQIQEPKSWAEAVNIINEYGNKMKAAHAKQDYQTMHELSYHLEVAADYLEEETESLMDSIEVVHHTTEDGEYEKMEKAFPTLEKHLSDIAGK